MDIPAEAFWKSSKETMLEKAKRKKEKKNHQINN
jgi:hypothetical protein